MTDRRAGSRARIPEDHVIVLFGATGDLARRMLLPGMFHLAEAGLMPDRFRIVGVARSELTDDEFRELARTAVEASGREPAAGESWQSFAASLSFASSGTGFEPVAEAVRRRRDELGEATRLLHYLSVPPRASAGIVAALGELGLNERARIILEKPFGTDLGSARALNSSVRAVFEESQVFRIDHYIGREAVQNLLAMRFANGAFEPVWNRNHIDHVQIDVPETLSIEMRAEFYEGTGAFRDMVATHLFQVLGFVAMEPPTSLEGRTLIGERMKVFESMLPLRPADAIRGQYTGYREESGVAADSDTETFVALKVFVDNWRWAGVPFYLRAGKRMAASHHLLTIAFRPPPRRMFPLNCDHVLEDFGHDHLSFELGDPGSIAMSFLVKVPGAAMELGEAHMDFSYSTSFGGPEQALDPYERLLHDVMVGDRMLFTTSDAIERLWEVSRPLLESPPPLRAYETGSWGPAEIEELIAPRRWHLPTRHS